MLRKQHQPNMAWSSGVIHCGGAAVRPSPRRCSSAQTKDPVTHRRPLLRYLRLIASRAPGNNTSSDPRNPIRCPEDAWMPLLAAS